MYVLQFFSCEAASKREGLYSKIFIYKATVLYTYQLIIIIQLVSEKLSAFHLVHVYLPYSELENIDRYIYVQHVLLIGNAAYQVLYAICEAF